MKKLSKTKKIWIIAIVSTLFFVLFEGVLGVGVGLIGMGSGGEMRSSMTLGGFVQETYYPLTTPNSPNSEVTSEIFFHPITFIIMFFVRLLIIIPLVNFFDTSDIYSSDSSNKLSKSGRLKGFFKYFVILYMIIGIGQAVLLVLNSMILKDALRRLSRTDPQFLYYYIDKKNLLILSIICCIIVVIHHFITDGLILLKKPSYLKFYRLSYILVFICPIVFIIFFISSKVRYFEVAFFKLQLFIYVIDFILFLINLAYLKDSYEVYEFMNSNKTDDTVSAEIPE